MPRRCRQLRSSLRGRCRVLDFQAVQGQDARAGATGGAHPVGAEGQEVTLAAAVDRAALALEEGQVASLVDQAGQEDSPAGQEGSPVDQEGLPEALLPSGLPGAAAVDRPVEEAAAAPGRCQCSRQRRRAQCFVRRRS